MAVVPPCLQGLTDEQRLHNHTGNAALTDAQIVDYVRTGYKGAMSNSTFPEQVWKPGAETALHERMETLCQELIAKHLCLETLREQSLFVLGCHFSGDSLKT